MGFGLRWAACFAADLFDSFFRLDMFGFRQLNARQCRRVAELLTAQRAGRKCMCE